MKIISFLLLASASAVTIDKDPITNLAFKNNTLAEVKNNVTKEAPVKKVVPV